MEKELIALFGGGLAGQWLTRVTGGVLDDVGTDLRQWVRKKRGKNIQAVVEKAADFSGTGEVKQIHERVLVPLLNAASNEDQPDLQVKWAALLAYAADASKPPVPPAFPAILSELSPAEAAVLEAIYLQDVNKRRASITVVGPGAPDGRSVLFSSKDEVEEPFEFSVDEWQQIGSNLIRLTLCYSIPLHRRLHVQGEPPILPPHFMLRTTTFGAAFMRACIR